MNGRREFADYLDSIDREDQRDHLGMGIEQLEHLLLLELEANLRIVRISVMVLRDHQLHHGEIS